MRWFDKWFNKKSKKAWTEFRNEPCEVEEDKYSMKIGHVNTIKGGPDFHSKGMNFVIYPASGGHIVEYQSYDDKTDRNVGKLHIIKSDDDIGIALGHIVTMECLCR